MQSRLILSSAHGDPSLTRLVHIRGLDGYRIEIPGARSQKRCSGQNKQEYSYMPDLEDSRRPPMIYCRN